MDGYRRANGTCMEAEGWAVANFGGAQLGDERRNRRFVQVAQAMAKQPGQSLPAQAEGYAELMGMYRLFSNPQIEPKDMIEPHIQRTRRACEGEDVVLVPQDPTDLDFTHRQMANLGQIGDGGGQGLIQHGALAVSPRHGLLGMLDVQWYRRPEPEEDETRRQRRERWATTDAWADAARSIGKIPGTRIVHVADRHSDVFSFLSVARSLDHGFVIRAMHDRHIDEQTRLWPHLRDQPVMGHREVQVKEQRDKKGKIIKKKRKATVTIRFAPVQLQVPRNDPRFREHGPLNVWAIYLHEDNPPADAEPVSWMLLSSEPVHDIDDAQRIIGWYELRWVIEEWHRVLKEGCRLEKAQLDDAEDIKRLAAVKGPIAVRLLQLRDLVDEQTSGSEQGTAENPKALRRLMPETHIRLVAKLTNVAPEQMTPRRFWLTVAKKGGYLGRKRDPRPGWKVIWRGWEQISNMAEGVRLLEEDAPPPRRCV